MSRPPRTRAGALPVLAVALGVGLTLGLSACGKKGDPLPPIRQIPETPDLRASQRGPRLLLSLPYPSTTAAGTSLPGVAAVTVWSAPWSVPAEIAKPEPMDARQFESIARQVHALEGAELEEAVRGGRIAVELPLADVAAREEPVREDEQPMVTVAVKTRGPSGEDSAFSRPASFVVVDAPEPPTGLSAEGESEGVRLAWSYPEELTRRPEPKPQPEPDEQPEPGDGEEADADGGDGETEDQPPEGEGEADGDGEAADDEPEPEDPPVVGFNVYRRAANERVYGEPVRSLPGKPREIVDETARLGERYVYTVTAVSQRRPALVESAFGEEVEVDYRDRFPPPVPTGVVALLQEAPEAGEGASVRVVWRPVDAPDLAGYRVYRMDGDGGELVALHEEPVQETELVDRLDEDLPPGTSVTYRVRAVDRSGNESGPSEPATATVR